MARKRIIEVSPEARSEGQHRAYLERELGPTTFGRPLDITSSDRPVGLSGLIVRPSGLFAVALMAFLTVSGVKLWQLGLFDPLFAPKGAQVERGANRWMLGDRVRAAPERAHEDAWTTPVKTKETVAQDKSEAEQ